MPAHYTPESSRIIFTHPRLQLSETTLVLPDGTKTDYLLYDNLPDSVCILALNDRGQILVNSEYSFPANEYLNSFPAGVVEANETPEQTAHRELREETGLTASKMQKLGQVLYNHRRSTALYYFFLATELTPVPHEREAEELIESSWLDVDQFQRMVVSGDVKHIGTIAAWGMYLNAKQLQE